MFTETLLSSSVTRDTNKEIVEKKSLCSLGLII